MPLSLYGAWLPMRMYGGGASGGPMLPHHLTSATYPSQQGHQNQLSQHLGLGLNHFQGAAYPGHHDSHRAMILSTDSDDDGSLSPVHDLTKSQNGKTPKKN